MKKTPNYNEAFEQLELLVSQLEKGDIPLETLADKVKQANELMTVCETKLRSIEDEITLAIDTKKKIK